MSDESKKLALCPFCGPSGRLVMEGGTREGGDVVVIHCTKCLTTGPMASTQLEAEQLWNRQWMRGQAVVGPVIEWVRVDTDRRLPCHKNMMEQMIAAYPKHPMNPSLNIHGPILVVDQNMPTLTRFGAGVVMFADIEGEREVVFEFEVPWREDMLDCSMCRGSGVLDEEMAPGSANLCPWCVGEGSSPMDEAKDLAAAMYWSWIRSTGPGGGFVG